MIQTKSFELQRAGVTAASGLRVIPALGLRRNVSTHLRSHKIHRMPGAGEARDEHARSDHQRDLGPVDGELLSICRQGHAGPSRTGPYATSMFFVIGVGLCCVPVNYLFMRKSLDGRAPVAMRAYSQAPFRWHLWGIFGGVVWCIGAVLNFVASQATWSGRRCLIPLGNGRQWISAVWGVFVWEEFSSASRRSKVFLIWMFALFLLGLTAVALAPIVRG